MPYAFNKQSPSACSMETYGFRSSNEASTAEPTISCLCENVCLTLKSRKNNILALAF
jgi:hypothetical protein